MGLSISEFKGQFQSGARPNLYSVIIAGFGGFEKLEFLCKATQMPASTVAPIEVPYKGRQLKVAGNRTYADWTITVLNDIDFAIRAGAESWMDIINGPNDNQGAVNIADYMADATIQQLDQAGTVIYTYQLKDIWPTEVAEIELAYDSNDTIEEFTITFAIGSYFQSDGAKA